MSNIKRRKFLFSIFSFANPFAHFTLRGLHLTLAVYMFSIKIQYETIFRTMHV